MIAIQRIFTAFLILVFASGSVAQAFDGKDVDPNGVCIPCAKAKAARADLLGCDASKKDEETAREVASCMSSAMKARLARDPGMLSSPEQMSPEAWSCLKTMEKIGGTDDRIKAGRDAYEMALRDFYRHLDDRMSTMTVKLARDPKNGLSPSDRRFLQQLQALRDRNDKARGVHRASIEAELAHKARQFAKDAFNSPKTRGRMSALGVGVTPSGQLDFGSFKFSKITTSKAHAAFIRAAFGEQTVQALKRLAMGKGGSAVRLGNTVVVPGFGISGRAQPRMMTVAAYNAELVQIQQRMKVKLARYSELVNESRNGRHKVKEFGVAAASFFGGGGKTKLEIEEDRLGEELNADRNYLQRTLGQNSVEMRPVYQALQSVYAANGSAATGSAVLFDRLAEASRIVAVTGFVIVATGGTALAIGGPVAVGLMTTATVGAVTGIVLGGAFDTIAAVGEAGVKGGWDVRDPTKRCKLIGAAFGGMIDGATHSGRNGAIGALFAVGAAGVGAAGTSLGVAAQGAGRFAPVAARALQLGVKAAPLVGNVARAAPAAMAAYGGVNFGAKQVRANVLRGEIEKLNEQVEKNPTDGTAKARLYNRVAELDAVAEGAGKDLATTALSLGAGVKSAYDRWKSAQTVNVSALPAAKQIAAAPEQKALPAPPPAEAPALPPEKGTTSSAPKALAGSPPEPESASPDGSSAGRNTASEAPPEKPGAEAPSKPGFASKVKEKFNGAKDKFTQARQSAKAKAATAAEAKQAKAAADAEAKQAKAAADAKAQQARQAKAAADAKSKVDSKSKQGSSAQDDARAQQAERDAAADRARQQAEARRQAEMRRQEEASARAHSAGEAEQKAAEARFANVENVDKREALAKIYRARIKVEQYRKANQAIPEAERIDLERRALNLGDQFKSVGNFDEDQVAEAAQELKSHYRQRTQIVHPDLNRGPQAADTTDDLKYVNEAYENMAKSLNARARSVGAKTPFPKFD